MVFLIAMKHSGLRPCPLAPVLPQVASVAQDVRQRTVTSHFDGADRRHGHTDAIVKAPHIDADQGTEHNPDRGFMRYDEDVSGHAGLFYLLDHQQTAPGDVDTAFPAGGRVPARIGQPANVGLMKRVIDLLRGFPFPMPPLWQAVA